MVYPRMSSWDPLSINRIRDQQGILISLSRSDRGWRSDANKYINNSSISSRSYGCTSSDDMVLSTVSWSRHKASIEVCRCWLSWQASETECWSSPSPESSKSDKIVEKNVELLGNDEVSGSIWVRPVSNIGTWKTSSRLSTWSSCVVIKIQEAMFLGKGTKHSLIKVPTIYFGFVFWAKSFVLTTLNSCFVHVPTWIRKFWFGKRPLGLHFFWLTLKSLCTSKLKRWPANERFGRRMNDNTECAALNLNLCSWVCLPKIDALP